MSAKTESNWIEEIGKPALASLREMVAALECDYDRLDELREERDGWYADNPGRFIEVADPRNSARWAMACPDEAEELKELEEAAGECEDRDDAERRIHEDPLSIQVRSDWEDLAESFTASEFQILLCTGGPAVRIMGELDQDGEPSRAWLEVQDWGKPWTEYYETGVADVCLAYARCFSFGQ